MVKTSAPKLLKGKVPSRAANAVSSVIDKAKSFGRRISQDHQVKGMVSGGTFGGGVGAVAGGLNTALDPITMELASSGAKREKTKDPGSRYLRGIGYGTLAGGLTGGAIGGALGYKWSKPTYRFFGSGKNLLIDEVRPDLKAIGADAGTIGAYSGAAAGFGAGLYGAGKSSKPKEKKDS